PLAPAACQVGGGPGTGPTPSSVGRAHRLPVPATPGKQRTKPQTPTDACQESPPPTDPGHPRQATNWGTSANELASTARSGPPGALSNRERGQVVGQFRTKLVRTRSEEKSWQTPTRSLLASAKRSARRSTGGAS